MSNIKLERESNMKNLNLKVGSDNHNDEFISFSKNPDTFIDKNIGLDFLTNDEKKVENDSESVGSLQESDPDPQDPYNDPYMTGNHEEHQTYDSPYHGMSHEEILQKKAFFLSQLKRLESKGHCSSRRFGPEHTIEEIEAEVIRIKKEQEMDNALDYCKSGVVFLANTLEMANKNWNFANLDGFGGHIFNEKDKFDSVLEELYEKYAGSINTGPEIKFVSMFALMAFTFHWQKTVVDKAVSSGNRETLNKMSNIANKMNGRKMAGPSKSTEEILRNLQDDGDSDDSSVFSESQASNISIDFEPKRVSIPEPAKKKRGRPPKKN